MIDKGLVGVDFVAINTDLQALDRNRATTKVQIGRSLTRGLGAGADPSVGYRAVEENREDIANALQGSDMVFITAGMGGGTGTGGAPLVANIAKSIGALVVGIVTRPFNSEGKRRTQQADEGIEELRKHVDTLISIPNQRLLEVIDRRTSVREAFSVVDKVLHNAAKGISEIITVPGEINVDFADVRRVMREMGDAMMGTGTSTGENRAMEAAQAAISSPLLEGVSIAGAQGILINISGSDEMAMWEVEEATSIIHEAAGDDAEIIQGVVIDEALGDKMMVTVVATGFNRKVAQVQPKPKQTANLIERIERIPSGPTDLQKLDEPAYIRRGIELRMNQHPEPPQKERDKFDRNDLDRPAFLRKIMD